MANEERKSVQAWPLPQFESQQSDDDGKTNALNKKPNWFFEPPEPDEPEPELLPPTAEEIEAIRQAAWEEGMQQGLNEGREKGQKEGFEQGHQQGLEQGLQEGKEQGLAASQNDVVEKIKQFEQLMLQLHQPIEQVEQQLEQELVLLAVALAQAVIRVETQQNEQVLLQALNEAMKVLPLQEKGLQLRMHPDDISFLRQHFDEDHIRQQQWQLIEAPEMQRGGLDVVTQNNAVDLSVERRCRDILDKFLLDNGLASA